MAEDAHLMARGNSTAHIAGMLPGNYPDNISIFLILISKSKQVSFMRKRFLKISMRGILACGMFATALVLVGVPQKAHAQAATEAAAATITGTVTDSAGEPLIGATVAVKGTTNATSCDIDGNFSLRAAQGSTLTVSYVGYKPQQVKVSGSHLDIVLEEDNTMLDEVVVVGFGTAKKESLSGAVTVVDAKAFQEKGNLSSPLQALQGQVAGVNITRGSSAPGDEGWSMNLRGASSINSTEPLIIIDGVASESVNDLRLINSNDIESINFLKDGAAAIYGSRAAGGVVLITTKRGQEGRVKVEYSGSATMRHPGLMARLMSPTEWADMIIAANENPGNGNAVWLMYAQMVKKYAGQVININNPAMGFNGPSANPWGDMGFKDVGDFVFADDVDWVDSLFGNAWSTSQNLSISGGSEANKYRLSLGYMYDGSPLKYGKNNNQRYNIRLNDTWQLSKRIRLESMIAYNRQEQVAPTLIGEAISVGQMPQPCLPLTTISGKPYKWGTWVSPVARIEEGGENKLTVSAINISETLSADIAPWLDANVNVGYNSSAAWRDMVRKTYDTYTYLDVPAGKDEMRFPYSRSTSSRTDFYSLTGYLHGHHTFAKQHNLSLTAGVQYEFKDYRVFGVAVRDPNTALDIINGTGEVSINDLDGNKGKLANRWQFSNLSYFFRFNYDFDGRYLLEFNGRYDGSSKFQSKNRWEFFYGVSGAWRINQEKFLRDIDWISNLKVRLSYAEMGNQSGISNYDGYQLYVINSNNGAYVGNDKLSTITTNGTFASNSRSWERIKNFNVGLDFGFLNGAISGSVDYFEKHNNNMLIGVTYPALLGDKAPSSNSGKFKDWGFDGQITYNGRVGDWNYHVGGTFTFARNKIQDIQGSTLLTSGFTSVRQGYPINSLFGLRYGGKIQNEEQLRAYVDKYFPNNGVGMPDNLRVGDNMFCDENGDGVLDYNDYIFLGSDTPEISYSFNFGVNWKGIDVNFVFQGAANRFIYRGINNLTVPMRNWYTNTANASVGNVWSPSNPDAYFSPYIVDNAINNYNYQASSLTAQDGRYLRLKNVTVGYTFPAKWMKATHCLTNARVYITGEDLWETTKMQDGYDPEAGRSADSGFSRYPFTRNWTFGLNLTF